MHTSRWVMAAAALALALGMASTLVAQTAPAAKTGSVSGTVVDKDGKPAAGAAISYTTAPAVAVAPGARGGRRGGRGTRAGTTDDKGAFTIKDAPVGDINITAMLTNPADNTRQRGMTAAPVVVKEGQETKLAEPIKLTTMPARRGGGGGGGGAAGGGGTP